MTHKPVGSVCHCNTRGWMPGVEHVPIQWRMTAYNERTDMRPVAIVDHIMQGYLNTMVEWARTGASRVIVHFGIGQSGRIVQMHPIFSPGIHAGAFDHRSPYVSPTVKARSTSPNGYTIGIEHEGCSVDPRPAYSVPPAFIYSRSNPWPDAMVQASIRVKAWCFEQATSLGEPSTLSIIGHYETGDPTRVNDPAAASDRGVWPRDRMIAALAKGAPKGREEEGYVDRDYTVIRPGEWLSKVAQRVGKSVDELVRLNGIADPNRVEAFQVLRLTPSAPIPEHPPVDKNGVEAELKAASEAIIRARQKLAQL